ncbi:hypothetical protein CTAYLR_000779 [Chrysophaeum taylorii]|uniref:Uncharacterized protein n=1 Tax=Chrysophaeum taylorii TaxID=2483200 RepID=A0AAD7UPX2_9STRA|nr:hypothetical protein CTAYLR_000779 [Chrysophaeum taylorii]
MGDVEAVDDTSALLPHKRGEGCADGALRYVETQEIANLRLWWGLCYSNAMGVCGIVLVALGSTLSSLAADCGTTATRVGTVFIARGIGAITGALSSARLYSPPRPGNLVMVFVLLALASVLLYMPFIHDVWILHLCWFLLGMCTATLDTGCQIMTRKVHGIHAGPWLGANTVCFAIAGALVPLIELITGELFAQYATLATIAVLNAAALYASRHPESPEIRDQLPPRVTIAARQGKTPTLAPEKTAGKYHLELIFGATVFWLIGGKVDTTSYIVTYVKSTGVIQNSDASISLLLLWIMITIGRLVGLQDQINLKKQGKREVYLHLTAWLFTGTFGMLLAALFPTRSWAFWVGVSLYGLGNGPCVGYVYDLVNRMTVHSEMGMSIVMFGLNFGASLVPYLTTVAWDYTSAGPETLVWVTLLSMFIPMPLLFLSASVGNLFEPPAETRPKSLMT